jgi:hypothetical protein
MLVRAILILARVFLVLFGLRLLLSWLRGRALRSARPAGREEVVDLVRDHTCNTYLPKDRALSAMVGGHLEHFCSAACRDRALAAAH